MIFKSVPLMHLSASDQPRPLVTEYVDKLAASMKSIGLISPITVQQFGTDDSLTKPSYKIVAGHHRVAAARSLGWTEIDAVISTNSGLEAELIEIDENLCRAELSQAQRTKYTKRRVQIWEALHPVQVGLDVGTIEQLEPDDELYDNGSKSAINLEVGQAVPPQVSTHGGARPQTKGFAAATAAATGQSKRTTNRALTRAEALGDDTLDKITGTSLDSGAQMDALAKLPAPERAELIERAAAGEQVSARPAKPVQAEPVQADPMLETPIVKDASSDLRWLSRTIKEALREVLNVHGCLSIAELANDVNEQVKSATEDELDAISDTIDYLEQWTRALSGVDVVALASKV